MDTLSKKKTARRFKSTVFEKKNDNGSHFVTVTAKPESIFFNLNCIVLSKVYCKITVFVFKAFH